MIHCDPRWNPAVEDQASDRAHRIGQHREVTVYKLLARGTVEDKIAQLEARKRALADAVVRDDAGALRGLSEDDVRLLLGEVAPGEGDDADDPVATTAHAGGAVAMGARGPLDVGAVRTAALRWIDRPGATRRTLAGEALVRQNELAVLLRGQGAGLPAEVLERVWAVVRPRAGVE